MIMIVSKSNNNLKYPSKRQKHLRFSHIKSKMTRFTGTEETGEPYSSTKQ